MVAHHLLQASGTSRGGDMLGHEAQAPDVLGKINLNIPYKLSFKTIPANKVEAWNRATKLKMDNEQQ
jgi:hypothetical protein